MGLGIDSFKIEGRMKGDTWQVSRGPTGRRLIDFRSRPRPRGPKRRGWKILQRISHRPYTKGNLFSGGEQTRGA